MNTGIYEIRNTLNGKRYIGSAVNFHARWTKHQSELRRGVHHSNPLQRAWNKHGQGAFQFVKILICERAELITYEQMAFTAYKPQYNVSQKAGSSLGVKRSPESIAKMMASRKTWAVSLEARAKISASLTGRPGRSHDENSRRLMSERQKGKLTPHLERLHAAKVGIPRPQDVREKLSRAVAKFTDEQVREIRSLASAGNLQKAIANQFGIRQSCVSEIVRGISYAWVK